MTDRDLVHDCVDHPDLACPACEAARERQELDRRERAEEQEWLNTFYKQELDREQDTYFAEHCPVHNESYQLDGSCAVCRQELEDELRQDR